MRRTDENAIIEMVDAAGQLVALLRKPDAQRLLTKDRVFRHSVFFEFLVIGEQAGNVSNEFKERYPEVPWRNIIAFRHRVAHGYFELSLPIVRDILTLQIPELFQQLTAIRSQEFPAESHGLNH